MNLQYLKAELSYYAKFFCIIDIDDEYMMNSVKEIKVKNRTYYSFDDMIIIKNLDPNKIKIDGKSYRVILIDRIGSMIVKTLGMQQLIA